MLNRLFWGDLQRLKESSDGSFCQVSGMMFKAGGTSFPGCERAVRRSSELSGVTLSLLCVSSDD